MERLIVAKEIERLLQFAVKHKMIEVLDVITSRNALMDLLRISEPYNEEIDEEDLESENLESPSEILSNLLDYASEIGLMVEDTITYRDLLDAKIMGILMPRQSEIAKNFYATARESGIEQATNNYYAISKSSNYIRMDRIAKNLYWLTSTKYGNLEITVNLSKPEKDPKDIAASKLQPQSDYPKCLLCLENVGFAGHINHPARQNHRVIPVNLNGDNFYLQYSPYVYYNEHCILFYEKHIPMKISQKSFERLLCFVELFPHYFIGSNADLPIVGGSILSHEHFQGGRHVFPIQDAIVEESFIHSGYTSVKASIVKWPMSVVRLSGNDKEELVKLSMEILDKWKNYSDNDCDILSFSKIGEELIPHNTITPITRKNDIGEFEMDLVLRNNRTSEEHPDGIFHPHQNLHHIKKENIGLIEVMGLAVLPARLTIELKDVADILTGKSSLKDIAGNKNHRSYKHLEWIEYLIGKYGISSTGNAADVILKREVGEVFLQVLLDAGVYKRDEKGSEGFKKFMAYVGFELT